MESSALGHGRQHPWLSRCRSSARFPAPAQAELRLLFEDGTVRDVSFADHEWTGIFEALRDPTRFAKVTVRDGTLYWPHDELDWAPEPLYEAAREHSLVRAAVARS